MRIPHNATFVLVNDSVTDADTTPAALAEVAAAIDHALQNEWKEEHGNDFHCVAGSPGQVMGPLDIKVSLQEDSSVQGAAGYHDDDGIYCFRDGLPSFSTGDFAFSVVISHEIFESAMDPGANRWADNGNGTMVALEACDAVEGYSWVPPIPSGQPGAGVSISDFLMTSFFDADGKAPYSRCGKPTAPFTTAPDNGADYQIQLSVNESGEQQVTAVGNIHGTARKRKSHPSSRTSRRGVKLAAP
jgi:hypothetical protein